MFVNLYDSHMHTTNSHDAEDTVAVMARAAIEKGVRGIAITDHCEMEKFQRENAGPRLAKSVSDALEAREQHRGLLHVAAGIELGQPHGLWDEVDAWLDSQPYDFVLASVHRIKAFVRHLYNLDYAALGEKGVESLMQAYFDDMTAYVQRGNFDVLAHLSFPLRSALGNSGIRIRLEDYSDRIDEVLHLLRDRGKGLEVNLSGLRSTLKETMPPLWVVRRFRELGGEIVTVGSDAHSKREVALGIQEGMELLSQAGFRDFAFYRERKPMMLRLY